MNSPLLTLAERSGFAKTGGIEEVERLSAALEAAWPDAVRSFEFGESAQGRPLRALLASRSGACTPEQLRDRRIPVLMIQAGIHPGESDGKDAGFIALRELLSGGAAPESLERIALLFVPAFNTDGHARMGRWNRPNQNGPEITGWRTTAQNLNLNRDYTKAETPEMRAMLGLLDRWDPLICADLHVTDGADFEPDVSIQVEPINQGDPRLHARGLELREGLIAALEQSGALPLPFYPDLFEVDNPESGFVLTAYSPRFSTGYFPQRNRFTVLVETHSWKPYERRVKIMRESIVRLAELTARHGAGWLAQAAAADLAACAIGGSEVILDYRSGWREPASPGAEAAKTVSAPGAAPRSVIAVSEQQASHGGAAQIIDFRGYAYTRTHSEISGTLVTVYDPASPQIWRVPYRDRVEPRISIVAPRLGYFIPRAYAREIGARLQQHGIKVSAVPTGLDHQTLQRFRAARVSFSTGPFEGRMRASIDGAWDSPDRDAPGHAALPGTFGVAAPPDLFVPISQPLARLVIALLEPQAPDSYAAWGYFNACFEQKEQLEPYVAEQMARELSASNPELRAAFDARLAVDPKFAADPAARLEFFWRHHASWDGEFNCYPIRRI
jgi:murein tripeptide amidase MpaA